MGKLDQLIHYKFFEGILSSKEIEPAWHKVSMNSNLLNKYCTTPSHITSLKITRVQEQEMILFSFCPVPVAFTDFVPILGKKREKFYYLWMKLLRRSIWVGVEAP